MYSHFLFDEEGLVGGAHDERDKTVLVTGAMGRQGDAVIRNLLPKGWKLRALTRNPTSASARDLARQRPEVVQGDLDDAASLELAVRGVHGVYRWRNGCATKDGTSACGGFNRQNNNNQGQGKNAACHINAGKATVQPNSKRYGYTISSAMILRALLISIFSLLILWAAQLRELSARLELATGPGMPARVYLFKDKQPFRLNPVQALLPLKVDLFYRERLWTSGAPPETLEVTCNEQSHFLLLKGRATFDLPAGHYRVEAYHGLFYRPASEEFDLRAGETRQVLLRLQPWTGAADQWLSGDDHIHLGRERRDDPIFLQWLQAEDLSVGNFLQLQRQADAATQYAFGRPGEARAGAHAIRPGHESRSQVYGHVNLLGGRELVRPLSTGSMYANSAAEYPFPSLLFAQGRTLGATVGFAHFDGSQPHSTLLADLVLGHLDFTEVFQFGVLKTKEWYELLNAGLRVTGIAGSDFPVPLNRTKNWPRWLPLLGPERTLVKAGAKGDPYQAWAAGVRKGEVVVSNGPLVEIELDAAKTTVTASAGFYRPLQHLDIVVNGAVAATVTGSTTLSYRLPQGESCWVAAHVVARSEPGEPEIQAHTNPVYVERNGKPVMVRAAREAVAARWQRELEWYRSAQLAFPGERERNEFFEFAEKALRELRKPLAE